MLLRLGCRWLPRRALSWPKQQRSPIFLSEVRSSWGELDAYWYDQLIPTDSSALRLEASLVSSSSFLSLSVERGPYPFGERSRPVCMKPLPDDFIQVAVVTNL